MNLSLIIDNLITPPILFFFLGMAATWFKSDLDIPQPIAKFLSLYLLFAIGFHGGVELAHSGLTGQIIAVLAVSIIAATVVPIWSFFILRLKLDAANAAAIAATYGSISAVTFITAVSFLDSNNLPHGGYMVACMALMESPAIIAGVLLYRIFPSLPATDPRSNFAANSSAASASSFSSSSPSASISPTTTTTTTTPPPPDKIDFRELAREAFLNGAIVVLLGSLAIGAATGQEGWAMVKPLAYDPFKGVLCIFLLDMGLVAAKRLGGLKESGLFLGAFSIIAAIVHAGLGIGIAKALGMEAGDALLLAVLFGSASYIAVPAAMRLAIPEANPSLYVPMSLAITFPFNIALGIPLYLAVIRALWGET